MSAPRETKVSTPPPVEHENPHEGMSMLMRLVWMMAGNVGLIFSLISAAKARGWSVADAVFWGVAGSMIAARFLDIRYFNGSTTSGEPATMRDFTRYSLMLLLGGGALWGIAHAVSLRGAP